MSKNSRGAVLIMVLWVLMAMSLLALSFSASIRTEVNATRNVIDQKQSYYMARAGIEYAIYKLIESQLAFFQAQQMQQQGLQAIPQVMTGSVNLSLANGGANVEIIDETGKLNLNLAPSHLIFNLLITVGIPAPEAEILTDSIEDWRDPDDMYRPNGAESDYYQSLPQPYFAKNGSFAVPEELLLVRGVTPEIYYGKKTVTEGGERVEYFALQKYFTTATQLAQINVNSAPVPVLASIPEIDYEVALQIDALRKQAPLMSPAEIMEKIPGIPTNALGYLSTMRSNVYTLVSDGRVNESGVISRIRAVVQIGIGQRGYAVIYWNEANTEL